MSSFKKITCTVYQMAKVKAIKMKTFYENYSSTQVNTHLVYLLVALINFCVTCRPNWYFRYNLCSGGI